MGFLKLLGGFIPGLIRGGEKFLTTTISDIAQGKNVGKSLLGGLKAGGLAALDEVGIHTRNVANKMANGGIKDMESPDVAGAFRDSTRTVGKTLYKNLPAIGEQGLKYASDKVLKPANPLKRMDEMTAINDAGKPPPPTQGTASELTTPEPGFIKGVTYKKPVAKAQPSGNSTTTTMTANGGQGQVGAQEASIARFRKRTNGS